ncbi:MAG TPA: flagellar hook-basal body complex protein, partial [Acetobacteraceae bacterium]|nr:flagellar hook-basal body complex protein [Acetobacteraceae bacterium]
NKAISTRIGAHTPSVAWYVACCLAGMDIVSSVAASRLVAQQRVMDVLADNIANANTSGFRAERVQFSDWLLRQRAADAPKGDRTIAFAQDRATWREQRAGTITRTGNPFDLAITGDGFFTVDTPRGPRLTRDGRFGLLPDGTLADGAGQSVLDSNGRPIVLSTTDTQVTIAGDGTISSENGQLAKIGVVQLGDPAQMTAEGSTRFRADTATSLMTAPGLVQGAVEDSNVQPVLEVTRMMDGLRQFQFVSQLVQAEHDRQQAVIDKLLPQQS